jgi:putative addiction module component (TIGR02574 family)
MATQASQILADALQLSEAERALIVQQLLTTLSPEQPDVSDDDLESELDRRLQEFNENPSTGIPWSELKRELLG